MSQRAQHVICFRISIEKGLIYIDDGLIVSINNMQHAMDIDKVPTPILQAGVTLNLSKCHFLPNNWISWLYIHDCSTGR